MRFRDTVPPSRLERRFDRLWTSVGGPLLIREFAFEPKRRWRSDFAHLPSRTLIEIEGGLWIHGRHNSARGFVADMEKYLEANLAGWLVIRLADVHLKTRTVARLRDLVLRREMALSILAGNASPQA